MPKTETVIYQNNTTVNALVQYSGTFVFKIKLYFRIDAGELSIFNIKNYAMLYVDIKR